MFNTGYPTTNFAWRDDSGAATGALLSAPTEGLNVPFFFVMSERGTPGEIYYGAGAEITKALGAGTFDPNSPFYNTSTVFAAAAMAGQGVEIMRLVDPDAKKASFGLFLSASAKDVTQYQKNADGSRKIDGVTGAPLPKLASDNVTVVKEPGVVLKWSVRKLADNEDFSALTVVTTTASGVTTKTYPIMAGTLEQGTFGNRQGFSLYSSPARGSTAAQEINSTLYRFVPYELPTAVSTTARPINDVNGSQFNDFSFKNSAVYNGTGYNYAANSVFNNNYVDRQGNQLLPYDFHVYGENIGLIGAAALAVSPEIVGVDAYELDLVTGTDLDGHFFDHIVIDDASSTVVNASVVNYASGGTDGDTSWAKLDALVKDWLNGSSHGEFSNLQQHPMTHYSDPGFSMPTKFALLNMLSLRDNMKIDLSTQDVALRPNTKAEDMAAAQTLLFRTQMYPQSIINGVGCLRVGIYAHAGQLVVGSGYDKIVPYTYNRLLQRRDLDGGAYIKGSSGGLPNSGVTVFRKANWVADDEPTQAAAWAGCVNVVRHATRTTTFYPSIRTVYPNDTSLLSDDEISDRLLYLVKICREVWANYAGARQPTKDLYPRIQNDINQRAAAAFSGDSISVIATVGQTAVDANLGSQISIDLNVTGPAPLRTMNYNVIVGRVQPE
jgi:hypothetical protein